MLQDRYCGTLEFLKLQLCFSSSSNTGPKSKVFLVKSIETGTKKSGPENGLILPPKSRSGNEIRFLVRCLIMITMMKITISPQKFLVLEKSQFPPI